MIFLPLCIKIQTMQVIQNDVIKCCKMMSSNVVLLHSNNCCVVLEPEICEDLDLHVAIFVVVALCCPFVGVLHKEQSLGSKEVLFVTQQKSSGQVVITSLLKKSFVCTESTLFLTSSLLWSSCLHYDPKMWLGTKLWTPFETFIILFFLLSDKICTFFSSW